MSGESETDNLRWFTVRSLYLCDRKKADGMNIFEERIVAVKAADIDEAFEKGEEERALYAKDNNFTFHYDICAYSLPEFPDNLEDHEAALEVHSIMYQSHDDLDAFNRRQYVDVEHLPDP